MEEKSIRKYAELMQELGLTGLEISENGNAIRLERAGLMREADSKEPTQPNIMNESSSDLIDICSPMVGVFYNAPTEKAAPFIKVGDTVHKGDSLCIIEAMKLMNEIVSEQSGKVAEVCVENNQIVDFGHVLFRLRKDQE